MAGLQQVEEVAWEGRKHPWFAGKLRLKAEGWRGHLDDTPLFEGSGWPRPGCRGNQRPVTSVARAGGGGGQSEGASDLEFGGVGCGLGKGGYPHSSLGRGRCPQDQRLGVSSGYPPAPTPHESCVFPVAGGDVAAGPSWAKSSL